jgi:translation initiation factor 1
MMCNDLLKEIEAEVMGKTAGESQIHVRVQQRNGRKCWTLIEGLNSDMDIKGLLKMMRKKFSCNGNIQKDKTTGESVVQLTGNHRDKVKHLFTVKLKIVDADDLVIHGAT